MRFSTFQVPTSVSADDDQAVLDLTIESSLAADRQGFDAVFLPEHHFTGYAPAGSDPVALAAYLAPQLTQAWIGFAVTVLPSWHPVRFVERMNLLDRLTKGRLLIGIGSGVSAIEHAGLGIRTDEMVGGMTDELLDIATALWAKQGGDPEVAFDTKYYSGNVLQRIVPSALTRPHPRLARVAARPEAISRAAAEGWPVFVFHGDGRVNFLRRLDQYHRELLAAGHPQETLEFCQRWTSHTVLTLAIGDTEKEARAYAMADQVAFQQYIDQLRPYDQRVYDLGVTSRPPFHRDVTNPAMFESSVLYGTADQVEEKIREFESFGIGNLLISFDYGSFDPTRRPLGVEMQQRFADEVLPRFDRSDRGAAGLRVELRDLIDGAEDHAPAISHPVQRTGA